MKIGMVCPYSWDVPGGVQQHIRDLAEALIDVGHEVSARSLMCCCTPPGTSQEYGQTIPIFMRRSLPVARRGEPSQDRR